MEFIPLVSEESKENKARMFMHKGGGQIQFLSLAFLARTSSASAGSLSSSVVTTSP